MINLLSDFLPDMTYNFAAVPHCLLCKILRIIFHYNLQIRCELCGRNYTRRGQINSSWRLRFYCDQHQSELGDGEGRTVKSAGRLIEQNVIRSLINSIEGKVFRLQWPWYCHVELYCQEFYDVRLYFDSLIWLKCTLSRWYRNSY